MWMQTEPLDQHLSNDVVSLFRLIGQMANDQGYRVYLVGGFVRDLFLQRPSQEADIVVEGDGPSLAALFGRMTGWKITVHKRFLTATAVAPDEGSSLRRLDFVTARQEVYPRAGSLPVVRPARLTDDLLRRDFSINALALSLNQDDFGCLLDPVGGWQDLRRRLIRVLHDKSFRDDPTRMLRAVRYEQRFGFRMDRKTVRLMKEAIRQHFLATVSRDRIKAELLKVFQEDRPGKILLRMKDLGLLKEVAPELRVTARTIATVNLFLKRFQDYQKKGAGDLKDRTSPLMALLLPDEGAAVSFAQRFQFSERWLRNVRGLIQVAREAVLNQPSDFVFALRSLPPEMALAVSVLRRDVSPRQWRRYFFDWRLVRPDVTGEELTRWGLKGKEIQEALTVALRLKLDFKADPSLQRAFALLGRQPNRGATPSEGGNDGRDNS
ncbi:MAG: hypothetical protein NZ959_03415 [Armatimonadetes bacterium]|nr:hypothetical protein [Armatimonadota bacterium]MDW8121291.1 hypothetical protein [Armatimonadota bacterium]